MSDTDIFEETVFRLKAWMERGAGKRSDVRFVFQQEPGAASTMAPLEATLEGEKTKTAKAVLTTVEVPKVKDDADNFKFTYSVEIGEGKKKRDFPGASGFVVWPQKIHIEGSKDGDCKLDLKKVPYRVSYTAGSSQSVVTTATEGELDIKNVTLKYPGPYVLDAVSPYYVKDWKKEKGRTQKATVGLKPWKAVIRDVAGGRDDKTPIKKYVNIGNILTIKVGPQDLALAVKDQEIKVRVTFPKENSKRRTPLPKVTVGGSAMAGGAGDPGDAERKYEAVVKIPADAQPVEIKIYLGRAGGDRCKVEVGVTDTLEDDKLFVETWRKIGLELLMAHKDHRQLCDDILAPDAAALGAALLTELKRIFDGTFIEFFFPSKGCVTLVPADFKKYLKGDGTAFTWEDIQVPDDMFIPKAKFVALEYDASTKKYVKKTFNNGDKVFLCSTYQRRKIRDTKLAAVVKPSHTMTWLYVDFISARAETNPVGSAPAFKSDMSDCRNFIVTTLAVAEAQIESPFAVFDHDPIEADGSLGVSRVRWRAKLFRKKGAKDWSPITALDPGGANLSWSGWVDFTTTVERDKWCELVDCHTLKVKLPKDDLADPGNLLEETRNEPAKDGNGTEAVTYEIAIQLEFHCYGVSFGTLGGASGGSGYLRTGGGRVTVLGMAQTMAHEIGHNCGQTYLASAVNETGGWTEAALDGIPFPAEVPASPYYLGRGHTGSHCAKALMAVIEGESNEVKQQVCAGSFASPSEDHRTKYFSKVKQKDQCIMYGDGPEMATESMDFCETCKTHLRAVDLSDITKTW